jgi:diadenosine tetraphosphate (Ap4A) HIT family hydrolase
MVSLLSPAEWADLHTQLAHATHTISLAFQPDHFNYAFLQNQDRHIHFHIIPRYRAPRVFGGDTFIDPDYPSHYAVPAPSRVLSHDQFSALVDRLISLFADVVLEEIAQRGTRPE